MFIFFIHYPKLIAVPGDAPRAVQIGAPRRVHTFWAVPFFCLVPFVCRWLLKRMGNYLIIIKPLAGYTDLKVSLLVWHQIHESEIRSTKSKQIQNRET